MMMAAQRKGLHVFTFTRYPWVRIFGWGGGGISNFVILRVDENDELQRRRLTKAPETQALFIGDSPPDEQTATTYQ
jgi:hypothetical protein